LIEKNWLNFAPRSLKIFLSRKTEGIDPMKSWQPTAKAERCQIQPNASLDR